MRKLQFFGAGLILLASSCLQILDAGYDYTGYQNEAIPCNEDANCDDNDSCTLNVCGENKVCEFKIVAGVAPEQVPGDCKRSICTETGERSDEVDDDDLPNDLESCTTDTCSNGNPMHTALPDGIGCSVGVAAGLCNGGLCVVECGPMLPSCNDGNPCTEDSCNANTGRCTFATLDGLPTPDFMQAAGDCKQQICINGVSTAITDDADLPNDGDSCTTESCIGGVPMQKPTNAGVPCNGPNGFGVCDEMGLQCVECTAAVHCPVPAGLCQERVCTNNVCMVTDVIGKEIPSPKGDCKKTVCNAAGMPADQIDNTDVPTDGNPCTNDVCTNGNPSNPSTMSGVACGGGGQTCDGMGQCIGCTTNADCGINDACKSYACSANKCNIAYGAPGMALPAMQQTPGDCKTLACDGMGNVVSMVDVADVPNDMNQCTKDSCSSQGVPSNPFLPLNTMCNQNNGDTCDGFGNCLGASGNKCMDGAACVTGFCVDGVCCKDACTNQCMACNVPGSEGACENVPAGNDDAPVCIGTNSCDGNGACKRDNGQPCGTASDCSSGFCADGVCCNTACTDTCKSCNLNGSGGTCSFAPNDTVDPTGPMPCNNPYRCDGSGVCKGLNGVMCTQATGCLSGYCVDGFCCNNVCDQLCKACSGALTGGTTGICSNISNGTDPANECPNGSCSGNGTCTGGAGIKVLGASCTNAGECQSGFCADGICCSEGCTGTCKVCAGLGVCGNVANNTQDPNASTPCTGAYRCDGAGVCKGLNSVPCTMDAQCFSGYCTDGFCCNTRCSDSLCRSCASTLNAAADGTCSFTKAGTDPRNECNGGTPNCNGAGMCSP